MEKSLHLMFVGAVALALAACSDPESVESYLKLSDAQITFPEKDGGVKEITVRANPNTFTVTPADTWVRVTEKGDKFFRIAVEPNDDAERTSQVTVKVGDDLQATIKVRQLGFNGMNGRCRIMSTWRNAVLSPNGKYLGGVYLGLAEDDSFTYTAVIRDLETDEQVEFGPYPQSLYSFSDAGGISDTGTLFVGVNTGGVSCLGFEIDGGDYFRVPAVESCTGSPVVYKTSSDGSVWVGYVTGTGRGIAYAPVKWVDGNAQVLPIPEKNFRYDEWWAGVMARGCSADGSIIYGTSWENYDYGMVYWDETNTVRWVGEDVHKIVETVTMENGLGMPFEYNLTNGMICWANKYQISPNGKWIAGTYRTETLGSDGQSVEQSYCPAFYNTETRTTTIFDDLGGCIGMGATDEGVGMVGDGTMAVQSGRMVDIATGTVLGTMKEWTEETYGMILPGGFIEAISQNGEVILGKSPTPNASGQVTYIHYYIAPVIR